MSNFSAKKMVMVSLFIALQVVLTRILSIQFLTVRISFSFIPLAMCAMIFGPVTGGIAAAIADLIGIVLFPQGPFFPGFILTAFLSGAVYGLFLYNKEAKFINTFISVFIVCLFLELGLNTLWLLMLYDVGFWAMLPQRAIKTAVMIPVQMALIISVWKLIVVRFKENFV